VKPTDGPLDPRSDDDPVLLVDETPPPGRDRSSLIAEVRAHPVTRITKKVTIAILGGAIVIVGLLLVPLPGPGWLIVLAGLGVWAIEFVWARQLLKFARARLQRWLAWVGQRPLWQRLLLGAAGLIVLGALAWLALYIGFGREGMATFWDYITTH
jgi:uncharacterized protein (TIGR02611 family)